MDDNDLAWWEEMSNDMKQAVWELASESVHRG